MSNELYGQQDVDDIERQWLALRGWILVNPEPRMMDGVLYDGPWWKLKDEDGESDTVQHEIAIMVQMIMDLRSMSDEHLNKVHSSLVENLRRGKIRAECEECGGNIPLEYAAMNSCPKCGPLDPGEGIIWKPQGSET